MFRLPSLGNGWADCVEIWYALGDRLVTAYAAITGGVSLHVRTCGPRFCISGTARPIGFNFGVLVGGHELLLPPNRLRPSFFAIFFKRLDKNPRNFRSEHLRTCPNFHYLDILLSHKYFRYFPLTRNVNFQAADSLSE